jgi:PRTRC genetic system protein E
MSTPTTQTTAGFFVQLMPLLADRTVMVIVAKADEQHLNLSVVPKRMKEDENATLTTPLCCTGTPEELDRDLPSYLRDYVGGQIALSNNLAQIQREREEAEKAAREDLKKKQKMVGNGGAKGKTAEAKPAEEVKVVPPPAQPESMNLFDQPMGSEAQQGAQPGPEIGQHTDHSINKNNGDDDDDNTTTGGEK